MKWFSAFLLFGLLALIGNMAVFTAAEPNPDPRGRPATTKRPTVNTENNNAGFDERRR
ncbi:uncharacterized protein LOC119686088 [Teleopsis dalmanni]|uniref:uncharacterized protein LOC119686088 n=1 Tax=Teleopsis dalmanni TaxID=139649 RepID=UPI0018CE70EB|nr:uncharacterized protein LOC119686088 [Teleopsis dalmanni]